MGPLKAEEIRADHITVSWKKPEDNGGSEITGYIIEKMDMESGRWVSAGEVKINIYDCGLIKTLLWVIKCILDGPIERRI